MDRAPDAPVDPNPLRLNLPARSIKPRETGLTILIDPGSPTRYFTDVIDSSVDLVDLVKFGWGTALVTADLEEKIRCLRSHGIGYFFGGTLFERCYQEGRIDEYVRYCEAKGCRYMEVSNGTINLSNRDKARMIRELARDFTVLSEVGYKDADRSLRLHPARWIEYIHEDLDAGARWTITEARESGTGGICRSDGELRFGLIEEILNNDVPVEQLVFEAPNKTLQTYFIQRVGANVNLANIALHDAMGVETLRLGLRSDTLPVPEIQ